MSIDNPLDSPISHTEDCTTLQEFDFRQLSITPTL